MSKDIFKNIISVDNKGPWNRATSITVKDGAEVLAILEWCLEELESIDWGYQPRNNFFTNEVIFYFNNLRDYTVFVLKYQR